MNYLTEINAFYDWLLYNPLPTGAIALWHGLMSINNKANWADEFTVANIVLQGMTGLSRQGLDKSRNLLIQKGLIQYKKGTSNKAGRYKMISLVRKKVGTTGDTKPGNKNPECKKVGTGVDMAGAQKDTQQGHKSSTLYKLNETKLNETIAEEDRGTPSAAALYDDSFKSIITTYEKNIRPITPLEAERLSKWLDDMDTDVIIAAIEEAIVYNKRSMKYIEGILRNWHSNNIRTKLDLDAYRRDWEDRKQSEGQASRDLNKTVDFARFEHHEYTDEQLESLFEEIG